MLRAYYRLWANHMPKNTGSFYTRNESLSNKLSFDISLLYKEFAPYKVIKLTSSYYPI